MILYRKNDKNAMCALQNTLLEAFLSFALCICFLLLVIASAIQCLQCCKAFLGKRSSSTSFGKAGLHVRASEQ